MKLEDYEYLSHGTFRPPIDIKEFVYKIIQQYGPISRNEIKERFNLPRTTIYDNIVKLMAFKQVRKQIMNNKRRGRPKVYYRIIE